MTATLDALFANRFRRGALLVCAAHAIFFSALFLSYFYLKATTNTCPVPFHFASLLMAGAMTMFAVAGSVTAGLSSWAVQMREAEPSVRWMAIAISCWLMFLFLEIVEWTRLVFLVDLGPRTPFGQIFLVITGFHWVCVLACVGWLGFAIADSKRRDVFASTIYSHFLNLLWLVMLVVLYLFNADLGGVS